MARRFARFTLAAFAVLAFPSLPAAARSVEEFYKGRTGIEANRATLQALVQYMVEQHFIARPIPIEDLFVPLAGVNGT